MDHSEITALAEGMVPVMREVVDKAVALPPELAAQIAGAVRLLHELPPITAEKEVRLTRVERDESGNFIPVYEPSP